MTLLSQVGKVFEFAFESKFIIWLQSLGKEGTFIYYLMNALSFLGGEYVLIGIIAVIYWGLDKKRGEQVGITIVSSNIIFPLIKNCVCRVRPFDAHPDTIATLRPEKGYSFPSGHSSGSCTAYLGTANVYKDKHKKWLWIVGIVLPILVALSRNYVGAHYPTDVIAGLLLGLICIFAIDYLYQKLSNTFYIYYALLIVGFAGFFYCTTEDFFTAYGILLGLTCGLIFEQKCVNFETAKVWWRIIIRVALGGIIFLVMNEGSKALVSLFYSTYQQDVWFERIFRTLRYAIVIFVLVGVYPLLFKTGDKLFTKWHWLKQPSAQNT